MSAAPDAASLSAKGSRAFGVALLLFAAVCFLGLALSVVVFAGGLNRTDGPLNIYYYLFSYYEPPLLLASLLGLLALFALSRRDPTKLSFAATIAETYRRLTAATEPRWLLCLIAVAVLLLCFAGTHLVYHRHYLFSMDEFGADFQARIFARGHVFAPIPKAWAWVADALAPVFVRYDPTELRWISNYLPVYAALRAVFVWLSLPSVLNPLLAGLTVLALAGVTRNLWPQSRSAPLIAVALLLSSSQFWITSMSGYSMPAHLCFNLFWLYLFTRRSRLATVAAPWLGFLAMGLHQFVPHALFAAPFLLRLLLDRRWKHVFYYAAVYLTACATCVVWFLFSAPKIKGAGWSVFGFPRSAQFFDQGINLALVVNWQSLTAVLLAVIAIGKWNKLSPTLKDCALGLLFSYLFYFCYFRNQGHGWGYRYIYGVLANIVLLAVFGWQQLKLQFGAKRAIALASVGIVLALFVQLPTRCLQVHTEVGPFARAAALLRQSEVDALIVPAPFVWYGQDLVRNDPFLEGRPKVFHLHRLSLARYRRLQAQVSTKVLPLEKLVAAGLPPTAIGRQKLASNNRKK